MILHRTSFYPTRIERVELARRRYFEDGSPPSGVVSDAVFQSWARCQRLHGDPTGKMAFEAVSTSRTQLSLQRNRSLHDAWREELPRLQVVLAATGCGAILTDRSGVLLGATCSGRSHEEMMPIAHRLGVTLSEDAVGTNAPGMVARTGQAACISGPEHFFEQASRMHCAAAPIRDIRGQLAGVLDISSEGTPFTFDAVALIDIYASAIENRLLVAQSHEHLIIRMHVDASLLHTNAAGLIGIDSHGEIAWRNRAASRLLGLPCLHTLGDQHLAEETLGNRVAEVASLPRSGAAMLQLPSGLTVWACAEMRAADGHRGFVDVLTPRQEAIASVEPDARLLAPKLDESMGPAPHGLAANEESPNDEGNSVLSEAVSLRESDRLLIEEALKECGGNVSKAAKKLNVSRGLIYRRMRSWTGQE